jgi:hypothetical protein
MLPIKEHKKRRHGTASKLAAVSALGGAVLGAGSLPYANHDTLIGLRGHSVWRDLGGFGLHALVA